MSRARMLVGIGVTALSVTLVGTGAFRPATGRAGRATGDPLTQFPGGQSLRQDGDDLDAQLAVTSARLIEKNVVATALVRGEIGLRQAAERFRVVTPGDSVALVRLRRAFPRATDTELLYRNVLLYVRGYLSDRPDLAPGLVARLEAELAETFPPNPKARPEPEAHHRLPVPTAGSN